MELGQDIRNCGERQKAIFDSISPKAHIMSTVPVGVHKLVLIISNTSWYIFNFRQGLIEELLRRGIGVVAAAPKDNYSARLTAVGREYYSLPMDNKGTSPLNDLLLLVRIYRLLRKTRPHCVLTFTIKPNIYTALAARPLGVPVIANIAGLGSVFVKHNWVTWLARKLYRTALRKCFHVFFQNRDDLEYFLREGLADGARSSLLPGSGVDLQKYRATRSNRERGKPFRFLLFGRLLWEKGVGEYVDAARSLKREYPHVEFVVMGFLGVENPSAIHREQIDRWVAEGAVSYIEATDNVVAHIEEADCVVAPTFYGEGTPRTILEAASMGKPVIATDLAGCRDAVEHGVTGFLVQPRNSADLADKMERMLLLPEDEQRAMGILARKKMVREFDERIVIELYLQAISKVASLR